MSEEDAGAWEAHKLEYVLFTLDSVMGRRGLALNLSLWFAGVGVLSLLAGAALTVFRA